MVKQIKSTFQKLSDLFEKFDIMKAIRQYPNKELGLSILTGMIFFILPGAVVITFAVNLSLLMVHKLHLVLWIMFGILVLITYFGSHIFSTTLQNYRVLDTINYDKITYTLSLVINIVIFIIVLSILLTVT